MKQFAPLLLLFAPFIALAQPAATDVLNAEKNFAAYSVQHGTRAAFLQFADSNAVVFEQGKPVNAVAVWRQREARPGVLNWHPVYGMIASSGDLGFTTGPWTFQPQTINDSVVARGQYNTLWHKTANGEWKFLVDMGVGNTPDFATASFAFNNKPVSFSPGTMAELQTAEQTLIASTTDSANRSKAYASVVSRQAFLLNRNHRLPVTNRSQINELMQSMPSVIQYQQHGAGLAKSGDLGYVYGTTTINGKTDNYLRIWRREGKEWKLVLEVLPYENLPAKAQ